MHFSMPLALSPSAIGPPCRNTSTSTPVSMISAVQRDVWIAADGFVGPGANLAPGAVVGARAGVANDVEPGAVVVGNPARVVRPISR